MLRSVSIVARGSYTCLCVPTFLRGCNAIVYPTRQFHKALGLFALDKDVDKKVAISASLKTSRDDAPSEEVEMKLEGMMTSGIPSATLETHSMVIDGTRFDELPIIHVFSTRNNTIATLASYKGDPITSTSAGAEGFRNARKGTNIAGQAVGLSIGKRALEKGIKVIRIAAREYGPGRLPAIKGIQMGGVQIVSITDSTKTPFNTGRPKKQRRL